MVVYLPIAFIKDWICNSLDANLFRNLCDRSSVISDIPPELPPSAEADLRSCLITVKDLNEREEGQSINSSNKKDEPRLRELGGRLSSWEIVKCSLYLTPIWFITEVT